MATPPPPTPPSSGAGAPPPPPPPPMITPIKSAAPEVRAGAGRTVQIAARSLGEQLEIAATVRKGKGTVTKAVSKANAAAATAATRGRGKGGVPTPAPAPGAPSPGRAQGRGRSASVGERTSPASIPEGRPRSASVGARPPPAPAPAPIVPPVKPQPRAGEGILEVGGHFYRVTFLRGDELAQDLQPNSPAYLASAQKVMDLMSTLKTSEGNFLISRESSTTISFAKDREAVYATTSKEKIPLENEADAKTAIATTGKSIEAELKQQSSIPLGESIKLSNGGMRIRPYNVPSQLFDISESDMKKLQEHKNLEFKDYSLWINPDNTKIYHLSNATELEIGQKIPFVQDSTDLQQFSQKEYENQEAPEAKVLSYASEHYPGSSFYPIRGDGNCGSTSFAAGLICLIKTSQDSKLMDSVVRLITQNQKHITDVINAPDNVPEKFQQNMLTELGQLSTTLKNKDQKALFQDDNFMRTLSYAIRIIGNQQNQDSSPQKYGVSITTDAFQALAQLFEVPLSVCYFDRYSSQAVEHKTDQTGNLSDLGTENGRNFTPSFVICHRGAHFDLIIPKAREGEATGKAQPPPRAGGRGAGAGAGITTEQIQLAAAQTKLAAAETKLLDETKAKRKAQTELREATAQAKPAASEKVKVASEKVKAAAKEKQASQREVMEASKAKREAAAREKEGGEATGRETRI